MLAILAGTQCIALQTNSIEGAKNINKKILPYRLKKVQLLQICLNT